VWGHIEILGARGVERVLGRGGPMLQHGSDRVRESLGMFADELSAHRYLERLLWPNGVSCPRCKSTTRVGRLDGASTRLGTYKCYSCRKSFYLLHGTMMKSSHVPAHKWLQAVYLTDGGTKPVQAYHLHRILNVSLKTASSMMRRISQAAGEPGRPFSSSIAEGSSEAPIRNRQSSERLHA